MVNVEQIRIGMLRKHLDEQDVYRALGWSWPKWRRRMDNSDHFTIGELKQVARELGIPVRQLLAQDR